MFDIDVEFTNSGVVADAVDLFDKRLIDKDVNRHVFSLRASFTLPKPL